MLGTLIFGSALTPSASSVRGQLTEPHATDVVSELAADASGKLLIAMPKHDLATANQGLCSAVLLAPAEAVSVRAVPTSLTATHHMTLHMCPSLQNEAAVGKLYTCASDQACGSEHRGEILYGFEHMSASAGAAEEMKFPDGVTMPIGRGTPRAYAVVEMHNNAKIKDDTSGFELRVLPSITSVVSASSSSSTSQVPPKPPQQLFHLAWMPNMDAAVPAGRESISRTESIDITGGPVRVLLYSGVCATLDGVCVWR